ncbi:MAG: YolD-like family protein [Peptococcaceae bacterium]
MKDRGAVKWSALMLPEHKQLLEEFYAEQNYVEKPNLDQDKCAEINNILTEALKNNLRVKIEIYHDHALRTITGLIKKYDPAEQSIKVAGPGREEIKIYLNQIADAEIFAAWD